MPRQFSLRTLLWLMAVVAAFCAGAAWQRQLDMPTTLSREQGLTHFKDKGWRPHWRETIKLRDGSEWDRTTFDEPVEQ
jgi:hypothetical protein